MAVVEDGSFVDHHATPPHEVFGDAIAISGSTAVATSSRDNGDQHVVLIFQRTGAGTWRQQGQLRSPEQSAEFGFDVAIDGSTVVVGAPAAGRGGKAFVYTNPGSGWTRQATLQPARAYQFEGFGNSVAIDGPTIAVGIGMSDSDGRNSGRIAYTFTDTGGVWARTPLVAHDKPRFGEERGTVVGVSGSTVAVGIGEDESNDSKGAIYVFDASGPAWPLSSVLTVATGEPDDQLGFSVGFSGDTLVAGAPNVGRGGGAAYVFTRSEGMWSAPAKLVSADRGRLDAFGWSVATDGSTIAVGAPDKPRALFVGAAYIFTPDGAAWSQSAEIERPGADGSDATFGSGLALSNASLLIGAPGADAYSGVVYAYRLA